MKFAKKKLACLNCKAPIADGSLCAHCSPKVRQIQTSILLASVPCTHRLTSAGWGKLFRMPSFLRAADEAHCRWSQSTDNCRVHP